MCTSQAQLDRPPVYKSRAGTESCDAQNPQLVAMCHLPGHSSGAPDSSDALCYTEYKVWYLFRWAYQTINKTQFEYVGWLAKLNQNWGKEYVAKKQTKNNKTQALIYSFFFVGDYGSSQLSFLCNS